VLLQHHTRAFSLFAGLIVVIILAANILLFPIPYLGVAVHPQTHVVLDVDPGGSGDRAGLRAGDQVVRMYNRPIDDVFTSITYLQWIAPRDQPIPLVLERDGQEHVLHLAQDPPVWEYRLFMLGMTGLAFVCWLTGYVLGAGRSQSVLPSHTVAYFWVGIGGVVGTVPFALAVSTPLLVVLDWLTIGVFVPLAVYIHLFFPPQEEPVSYTRIKVSIAAAAVFVNALLFAASIRQQSIIDVLFMLQPLVPVALIIKFAGSAILLKRAYRHTVVAHTRRQIRLIASACGIVACMWMLLQVLPSLTLGQRLLPRNLLFLFSGLVPLAYLASSITPDLYRLDRFTSRVLLHSATVTVLGVPVFLAATQVQRWNIATSLMVALACVVVYRPVQHAVARALPRKYLPSADHAALDRAVAGLARTLEPDQLVGTLADGVRAAFKEPALAVYTGDIHGSDALHLRVHDRLLNVPITMPAGALTTLLRHYNNPIDSRQLFQCVHDVSLTPTERQLLIDQRIVLWGPIHHSQGHLLGLLLLGMRGDLDPYRPDDQVAIQRLLSAASLAFTNSAAYVHLQESESVIRHLYRRLQSTQDNVARALAQELHDEIINVHVRLNITSLTQVKQRTNDPAALNELDMVLESLRSMSHELRRICEDLYPTGLNDVYGLGAVLRSQLHQEQARWTGRCHFEETGTALPVAAAVQREALRITKEAVTNAVKHAEANTITVQLAYPATQQEPIRLAIRDDGRPTNPITERPDHLGLRYMRESAAAAGGTLRIEHQSGGGSTVVFAFSATTDDANNHTIIYP